MKSIKVILKDPKIIEQITTIIKPLGYDIEFHEMKSNLANQNFDNTALIIIDPNQGDPGLAEGIIDNLKSRSVTFPIPILLCTDENNDSAIVNGLNAGANDFILLPTTVDVLKSRLKMWIDKN